LVNINNEKEKPVLEIQ
jgi:hypothetical protein